MTTLLGPVRAVASPARRHLSLQQRAFTSLLVYYWALQYAVRIDEPVARGDLLYYLFIVPIAAFSLLGLAGLRMSRRTERSVRWAAAYMIVVVAVALARGDLPTILTTVLFTAGVMTVLDGALKPSTRLLNSLFLASIVVNSLMFLSGRSIYAVLPGLSLDGDLWWRVALFPHVATSAFFALIVLLVNIERRDAPLRRVCATLALYFVLLSGLRSALVAGLIACGYLGLVHLGLLRTPRAKLAYLVGALVLFVASLFATQLLLLLPGFGNETLNVYLFRSEGGLESEADVARSVYRTWLWSEHLRIAAANPVLGIGTFDFAALADYDPTVGEWGLGSESFLTGLYARVGTPALLLIATFVTAIRLRDEPGLHLRTMIALLLFVAMLAYGSFVNIYDFVFLVMLGLLAERGRIARRRRNGAPSGNSRLPIPIAGAST